MTDKQKAKDKIKRRINSLSRKISGVYAVNQSNEAKLFSESYVAKDAIEGIIWQTIDDKLKELNESLQEKSKGKEKVFLLMDNTDTVYFVNGADIKELSTEELKNNEV